MLVIVDEILINETNSFHHSREPLKYLFLLYGNIFGGGGERDACSDDSHWRAMC
jgi:hypothetical protein